MSEVADTVSVQIRADAAGLVVGMKQAGGATADGAKQMRDELAGVTSHAHGAGGAIDEFTSHVRGMRSEMRMGNFMAGQLAAMGVAAKSSAAEVTGLISAFAMGGGIGVAIESIKLIVKGFNEAGEEIKKANEKAAHSTKALKEETDLLILSINGATEAEKLRYKEIRPLDEQKLEQTKHLNREWAVFYEAEERLNEAKKDKTVGAQEIAAYNVAKGRVEEAQKLLDITKKQISEGKQAIGGVDEALHEKDLVELSKEAALHEAEINVGRLAEMKHHYDKVTAETEKWLARQDKLELDAAKFVAEAGEKIADENEKKREERAKRLSHTEAEEFKKAAEQQIAIAKQIGTAFGTAFGGIVDGTMSVAGAFKQMAKEIVKALIDAAIKSITASAMKAGGEAAAATAGIPVVGPVLAVGAMAAMEGVVLGLISSLPSAAGGFDIPRMSNPVTQLHGGEMVLPAHIADPLRASLSGGGIGRGRGDIHVHVHALDGQDAYRFFARPETQRGLRELVRNGLWPAGG